ncbi:serine hydrolase [bacterium]|nr:serine hydrolase [bacterium]
MLSACVTVSETQTVAPAAAPASTPAAATIRGADPARLSRIDEAMRAYVDAGELAGAVLVVRRDGREIYSGAWGWRDKEAGAAMQADTIFRIASQTKALVSVGVMMLQEDGKLLISDPVGKYLPEWSQTKVAVAKDGGGYDVVAAKRPITVRDLLTHTAGVSYGRGPAADAWQAAGIQGWYFADRTEPVSAVVARMAGLPMDAQPGERFVYGYSTDILGAVIEKVSGQTLAAFLDERLIKPLGMTDTSFYLPPEKASRFAAVYSANPSGVRKAPSPGALIAGSHIGQGHYLDGPRVAYSGGAGLLSTARDYGRFLQMMLDGGVAPDGTRLLSRKTVELMTVDHLHMPAFGRPGTGFGLGFQVTTDLGAAGATGSEGEFGWGGAYHSTYWVDPKEGLTVAYMTQIIPAGDVNDHGKVRALIYQALE